MVRYALLLNGEHYSTFLDNAVPGSEAHNALMGASPPTMGKYYFLICSTKAVEQLIELAALYSRDAVWEISRQLQLQKTGSE